MNERQRQHQVDTLINDTVVIGATFRELSNEEQALVRTFVRMGVLMVRDGIVILRTENS